MKLKKIDLSGVKDFLFQKGERVGVAICGAIALVLVGMGLMKAGGSSTPYAQNFKTAISAQELRIRDTSEKDTKPLPKFTGITWGEEEPRGFDSTPIVLLPDGADTKRRNPDILKVMEDDKHIQVDFVRGGYFSYELEKENVWFFKGEKGALGNLPRQGQSGEYRLTKIMKPGRFVLVSAVFPWLAQMREYQRKLRYETLEDLIAVPLDLPRPAGLNVYRCEITPDGKHTEWEVMFKYDVNEGKLEVAARIENLFKEAYIDEDTPKMFSFYVHHGLTTPLPELANMQYPKPRFKDIKPDDELIKEKMAKGEAGPRVRGVGARPWDRNKQNNAGNDAKAEFDKVSLTKLAQSDPEVHDQLTGKIDYFDPSALFQEKEEIPGATTPQPSKRRNPYGKPARWQSKSRRPVGQQKKTSAAEDQDIADALIRFIDVDVTPGKTYRYTFQVRMANPNFDKKEDVSHQGLAEIKELVSEFSLTPEVTIPGEYYYYAVDLPPEKKITGGSDTKPAKADKEDPYGRWNTAVQIHRWVSKFSDAEAVADWAIAERLLIRRGETVGRYGVMVEVPVWNKGSETFQIGFEAQKVNAQKKERRADTGLPLNFILEKDTATPPLLVDFVGGVKHNVRVSRETPFRDESAVEILVLTPGGKLEVRNSRHDTDPDYLAARERSERYRTWLENVKKLRETNEPALPGKKGPG